MSIKESIKAHFLAVSIQEDIIDKLLEEYTVVKEEALKREAEEVTLHASKFSDLALSLVDNYLDSTSIDIDNIRTGELIDKLINRAKTTPEENILTLAVPRTARAIHTIRNKKDIAHVKSIDPDHFDIVFCESASDWILAQFVTLIYGSDLAEIERVVTALVEKKLPWIQEFEDGTKMLLLRGLSLEEQILLVLYDVHPNYLTLDEICVSMHYDNRAYLKQLLAKLEREKYVHESRKDLLTYVLTRPGENRAETILKK